MPFSTKGLTLLLLGDAATLTLGKVLPALMLLLVWGLAFLLLRRALHDWVLDRHASGLAGLQSRLDLVWAVATVALVLSALPALGLTLLVGMLTLPALIVRPWVTSFSGLVLGSALIGGVVSGLAGWLSAGVLPFADGRAGGGEPRCGLGAGERGSRSAPKRGSGPMMVLSQDLPIVLTLFETAVAAIIAGSLLLPRGQIMVSEASSHAVLPGMVLGFLLSGEHGWLMPIGAIAVISLFLGLTSWLRRRHRLGASVEIAALFPLFFGAGRDLAVAEWAGRYRSDRPRPHPVRFAGVDSVAARSEPGRPAPPGRLGSGAGPAVARAERGGAGLAPRAGGLPAVQPQPDGRAGLRPHVARGEPSLRGLEIVLVATASAVCLRTAGVVVAVALFGAPIIGAWSLARRLWQAWLIAGVITLLGLGLSYVLRPRPC